MDVPKVDERRRLQVLDRKAGEAQNRHKDVLNHIESSALDDATELDREMSVRVRPIIRNHEDDLKDLKKWRASQESKLEKEYNTRIKNLQLTKKEKLDEIEEWYIDGKRKLDEKRADAVDKATAMLEAELQKIQEMRDNRGKESPPAKKDTTKPEVPMKAEVKEEPAREMIACETCGKEFDAVNEEIDYFEHVESCDGKKET